MRLFVFASNNLTNIWAGLGAGRWAVAASNQPGFSKGRVTKSRNMPVGAFGLLYCTATKSFTVPFVVYSTADEQEVVRDIWPEPWVLPFSIKPLGSPRRQLPRALARAKLPSVRDAKVPLEKLVHVTATTAFSGSTITDADWAVLVHELAD
jgi:hypothetical protein